MNFFLISVGWVHWPILYNWSLQAGNFELIKCKKDIFDTDKSFTDNIVSILHGRISESYFKLPTRSIRNFAIKKAKATNKINNLLSFISINFFSKKFSHVLHFTKNIFSIRCIFFIASIIISNIKMILFLHSVVERLFIKILLEVY